MNEIRDLIIGIDFGRESTQICYYNRKSDEPESLTLKAGENSYEIPGVLRKDAVSGGYVVGKTADTGAGGNSGTSAGEEAGGGSAGASGEGAGAACNAYPVVGDGSLISDIYAVSGTADPVTVWGEEKKPWELLHLFLQGVLRYLGVKDLEKSIKALAVATESLTAERVENLKKACEMLGFSGERLILLDYDESFYYHVMTQRKDIPARSTAWYTFDGNDVTYRKMTINSSVKPILVKMEGNEKTTLPEKTEARDEAFAIFTQKTLGSEMFSSIQITGRGFDQSWAVHSVRILCFGKRRVFLGNNLYARGACAAAKEKVENHQLKNYRFLSNSLVRYDVGMEMRMMGAPALYSLIKSGTNWYECKSSCELILDGMDELIFEVTGDKEEGTKRVAMKLPGLPVRPPKTTRLLLSMEYVSPEKCRIRVTDLGFGEMFPQSGKVWTEMVEW